MSESHSVQKRKALQRVEPAPIFVTDNVTFAGLRDLIKQEWDSNISPIELYVARLEKRVEKLRERYIERGDPVTGDDLTALLGPVPEGEGK